MSQNVLLAVRDGLDISLLERLVRNSFPKYNIIPFNANPNSMQKLVDEQRHKIPWNPPVLFFPTYDKAGGRMDEMQNWHPLFEKCKAVVIIPLLNEKQDIKTEEAKKEDAVAVVGWWNYGCKNMQWDLKPKLKYTIPFKIVCIKPDQTELTLEQRQNMQSMAEVKPTKRNIWKNLQGTLVRGIGMTFLLGALGWIFKRCVWNSQKA